MATQQLHKPFTRKIRALPGSTGHGRYYHIEVLPKEGFALYRTQDVGEPGGIQRVAGRRYDGKWETQAWLVEKTGAHVSHEGRLVIDGSKAHTLTQQIRGPIVRKEGDIFRAKPRKSSG